MKTFWARLGVSIQATEEQAEILKHGKSDEVKELIKALVDAGTFTLDGETYFPVMEDERYAELEDEVNVEF